MSGEASSRAESVSPRLVLASTSPRRRDLLAAYGYNALVAPVLVVESEDPWMSVRERVLLNAVRKSSAGRDWPAYHVVLGVDTLVSLDGEALGKPTDRAAAAAMVARLGGRSHQVFTGVALRETGRGRFVSFVEESRVTFRPLDAAQIAAYHTLIDPLDKAGGYAAQEHGEKIIADLEGSWTNVMGLPMERLAEVLAAQFGIRPAPFNVGLKFLPPHRREPSSIGW